MVDKYAHPLVIIRKCYCNSQNLWHLWVFFYSIIFFIFFWEVHIRAHTSTYVWRTNLHFQYV